MPLDRMLHPRAGHSDKVTELSDREYRVWTQYMLSADDFGLMPCEAIRLQSDNRALAKLPLPVVQKALERLIAVGLLLTYADNKRRYVCDPTWQKWQHIDYPKQSINPAPPPDVIERFDHATRELFRQCWGKPSQKFRVKNQQKSEDAPGELQEDSENLPENSSHVPDSRATRTREEAKAKANGLLETANGKRGGAGVLSGQLPRDHVKHAACDPTFARCVPQAVHDKLATALSPRYGGNRDAANAALRTWYPIVWAELGDDFVMPDAFKFWQSRFDAAFASTDAPRLGKQSSTLMQAVDRITRAER